MGEVKNVLVFISKHKTRRGNKILGFFANEDLFFSKDLNSAISFTEDMWTGKMQSDVGEVIKTSVKNKKHPLYLKVKNKKLFVEVMSIDKLVNENKHELTRRIDGEHSSKKITENDRM